MLQIKIYKDNIRVGDLGGIRRRGYDIEIHLKRLKGRKMHECL